MTTPITSFYRLQFGENMTFAKAADLVPYLNDLGISHLYASPIFEARPGSTHGYDVTDPNRFAAVLGGAEGFDLLSTALEEAGMGLMLDIVPNHMSASEHNIYFRDVLKHGRKSAYADFFDIAWGKDNKVTLPFLGKPLHEVLADGELTFGRETDEPVLCYFDRRFPVCPGTEHLPLRGLLDEQNYRLVYWRELEKLNYRRFFDITELIGVRQEDPAVFAETHRLIGEFVSSGRVQALRIDHIDGLRDPSAYLRQLAELFPDPKKPLIYVEKILEGEETLPSEWPVLGETGYWALGRVDRLFMPKQSQAAFSDYAASVFGEQSFDTIMSEAKDEILTTSFAHEFGALSNQLAVPDDELNRLARTFAVYRTYLSPDTEAEHNRREFGRLERFAEEAGTEQLLNVLGDPERDEALRFQQMTGPIMAKSLEDTAFYRFFTNLALNEVGADPTDHHLPVEHFNEAIKGRMAGFPYAMNALSTHDTKRSEDTRARLIAVAWHAESVVPAITRIANAIGGPNARSANHLVQAALAIWPGDEARSLAGRLKDYIRKAEREAKLETSWIQPNDDYENELDAAAERLVGERGADLDALVQSIASSEAMIVGARTVLKLTLPGVPDTYQGTEGIARNLVDPDNRYLPDWGSSSHDQLSERKQDMTRKLLKLRSSVPDLFIHGGYEPQNAEPGVLHYIRRGGGKLLSVAVQLEPEVELPQLKGSKVIDQPGARVFVLD
jgi:(1->4)-alpha-D-glucan 1-alpha-D-glucosylmutase